MNSNNLNRNNLKDNKTNPMFNLLRGTENFSPKDSERYKLSSKVIHALFFLALVYMLKEWALPALTGTGFKLENITKLFKGKA